MATHWKRIFDNHGVKPMSKTDRAKGAYVLNEDQKRAIEAAGYDPSEGGGTGETIGLEVLGDADATILNASYYNSLRKGANRAPEPRMGRDIIRWAKVGDEIVIGNIGTGLFVAKADADVDVTELGHALATGADPARIMKRSLKANGKPKRRQRMVNDFVRNPWVVAAALLRAEGSCESPSCTHSLFERDDGTRYLEVHHVLPLGEGGDDTLANVAAICPSCHRRQHYGVDRKALRAALATTIAGKVYHAAVD